MDFDGDLAQILKTSINTRRKPLASLSQLAAHLSSPYVDSYYDGVVHDNEEIPQRHQISPPHPQLSWSSQEDEFLAGSSTGYITAGIANHLPMYHHDSFQPMYEPDISSHYPQRSTWSTNSASLAPHLHPGLLSTRSTIKRLPHHHPYPNIRNPPQDHSGHGYVSRDDGEPRAKGQNLHSIF